MVDVDTPQGSPETGEKKPDNTTRIAAVWATAVAVPVMLIVGLVAFLVVSPDPEADPAPVASGPIAVPGTAVEVAAPTLTERSKRVCLAVTSQLPTQVRNLPARKVSAGPEQNAAFGEPPITLSCGVAQPTMCATVDDTSGTCVPLVTDVLLMNRVCWYSAESAGQTTFTTLDREVPVQVVVPTSYDNRAQWANEFSDILVETDKSITAGVPSGCKP
ncbi:hypothetical protein GCM10010168_07440 [Actinoplanes ianthinogenes]|uniref:DUF3515 domain-containing protein n=1 Tax=Actinoplanes ianthinogenes TaxID=122358 RepID=A0ABM7LTD8_9ACTN|nr:DUF3515 family protein [Actinoplanes ianthinogenes]BCJ42514.1 hypothetical protein Aiant_31710 [Actinoplanes ianthinogenes]GGQ94082.1 hypothetical protein GCM10010168_07440 [Actinoplanes ianthinogenes]